MSTRIPLPQRCVYTRRGSTSHNSTTSSSFSDDEDAITPCPLQSASQQPDEVPSYEYTQHQSQQEQHHHLGQQASHRPRARRSDSSSWRNSQAANLDSRAKDEPEQVDVDAETLWRRMLAIQRMFGCYNSARMRAALDTGADGFIPSRTCLDLLNDSIDQLPEESRRQLEEFLEHGGDASSRRKSWRQRLLNRNVLH